MIRYDVLIPAYNAETTISELIAQLSDLKHPPENIIIVDDGSRDRTVQICENHDVFLIRNDENRGKGFVLGIGFKAFLDNASAEYLLCMDADLQHPVSSIPDFLRVIERKNSKFVLGVRKNRLKAMPLHRILSNLITSQMISWLSGQEIKDSQCGFRLVHKEVLEKIHLTEEGYQLESEMLLESARKGFIIDWIHIPTIYNNEKSYIDHFSDTYRFVRLIFRELRGRLKWFTTSK